MRSVGPRADTWRSHRRFRPFSVRSAFGNHIGFGAASSAIAPSGLRPGVDYLSVSSADNFGIGAIAVELTSPHVPNEGVVGIAALARAISFLGPGRRDDL